MQIISPCNQNFNKMKKQGDGRYCASCEKVVVDFTKMSNKQLTDYLESRKSENICGRLKNVQLGKANVFENILFYGREFITKRINITPLRIGLLTIISGLMTFTTSCMGKVMIDAPVYRKDKAIKDTIKTKNE